MTRTVIVTGAYGYLGSRIRSRLRSAGWTTVALVRSPRTGDKAIEWSLGGSPPDSVLREADALVHCAWDMKARERSEIWHVNVEGTAILLEAAKRSGIRRLLTLSSMSAYPGTGQLYGQAKLSVEDIVLGLGGIAVRPGLVYGPDPGGMAGTLTNLTRLPLVPVFGDSAVQFPVHEHDFTNAIVEILQSPEWKSEVMGIAQPHAVDLPTLLAALASQQGRRLRFVRVPWQGVYWSLKAAETIGAGRWLPLRSDSLIGLVRPAQGVKRSVAFPAMLDDLRPLKVPVL